jgi:3-hydroxybutyrate dehydrogenase
VTARYIAADMSKGAECRALIEKAGGCDILVNNAGIQFVAPIEEFPVEKWDAILAINLTSAFHTTAAALPGMRKKGWGRVVNIASAHGLTASPFKSAYIAAKHGWSACRRPWRWKRRGRGSPAMRSARAMC